MAKISKPRKRKAESIPIEPQRFSKVHDNKMIEEDVNLKHQDAFEDNEIDIEGVYQPPITINIRIKRIYQYIRWLE